MARPLHVLAEPTNDPLQLLTAPAEGRNGNPARANGGRTQNPRGLPPRRVNRHYAARSTCIAATNRSCARTSPGNIRANCRSDTAGTVVATSNASFQRANPNMINLRIDRCTDEFAPDDQPSPSDSLNSGSTMVRPSGHAKAQTLTRRNNQVVDGPITGNQSISTY